MALTESEEALIIAGVGVLGGYVAYKALVKPATVSTPHCPSGCTGTYPNCQPCSTPTACAAGCTGTYPNCSCPQCAPGYTGTYPDCIPPATGVCPSGYTGTYPNCVPPSSPSSSGSTPAANQVFLGHLYHDILGRDLDQGGLSAFLGELNDGTPRATVAAQILNSDEHHVRLVNIWFQHFLNRQADQGALGAYVPQLDSGTARDQDIIVDILASPEGLAQGQSPSLLDQIVAWLSLHPDLSSSIGIMADFDWSVYADRVYSLLGVNAGAPISTIQQLQGGYPPKSFVYNTLALNVVNSNLVNHWFRIYLSRPADSAAISYFVPMLMDGQATYEEVQAAIFGSDEYFALAQRNPSLGQPGT